MISLDNLTVSYGGWTLFDNISFLINPKDRIGLVGKNGAGKTTLLRLIVGEQEPTSGAVTRNGDCTIGYLPQQMKVADTTSLREETEKAFGEVLRLEAEIASLTREIAERTGGQYFRATDEEALRRIYDQINTLEKSRVEVMQTTVRHELYVAWLLAAIALLLGEFAVEKLLLKRIP